MRIGRHALPALLELAARPEPEARRASLYPLAHTGGPEAVTVVRRMLHDPDQTVRDNALLAYSSLVRETADAADAIATAAPARLTVAILGPLTVSVEGGPLTHWKTVEARDLLAYFVLLGGRPVTRDQVLEALWPEGGASSARSLLHTTMYNLRGSLGSSAEGLVTFAGGAYCLATDQVDLDYDRFRRLAAAGDTESWRAAVALYRGDLLDGLDYPRAEGPRAQARRLYQTTLRNLADRLSPAEALDFLQLLIQVDPLDEDAHRGLMERYALLGNRNAALQQYRALAKLLDEELGLEPDAATQALYRQLIN